MTVVAIAVLMRIQLPTPKMRIEVVVGSEPAHEGTA